MNQELISLFTPDEFSLLMNGVQNIDVDDWKQNTLVRNTIVYFIGFEQCGFEKESHFVSNGVTKYLTFSQTAIPGQEKKQCPFETPLLLGYQEYDVGKYLI